jgi:uncharacterized protein (TIGR03067 family)
MTAYVALFFSFALPLAAAFPVTRDESEDETAKFQGTWVYESAVFDGREQDKRGIDEFQCIFRKDKYTFRAGDLTTAHGVYRLDFSLKPHTIDLTPTDKTKGRGTSKGIYEFDGKLLKICYSEPGAERAERFEAKEGSKRTLLVLKKQPRP